MGGYVAALMYKVWAATWQLSCVRCGRETQSVGVTVRHWQIHFPKSNLIFRDITRNVEENEILHKIFRVVSVILISMKIDYLWDSKAWLSWLAAGAA